MPVQNTRYDIKYLAISQLLLEMLTTRIAKSIHIGSYDNIIPALNHDLVEFSGQSRRGRETVAIINNFNYL